RINTFFAAYRVNNVVELTCHKKFSNLRNQVSLLDVAQLQPQLRNFRRVFSFLAQIQIERKPSILKRLQPALKIPITAYRLARRNFQAAADEPFIVRGSNQLPI